MIRGILKIYKTKSLLRNSLQMSVFCTAETVVLSTEYDAIRSINLSKF